jgi:hypothetical protein
MAQVIVPKNHAVSIRKSAPYTGTSILDSTTNISSQLFMEDGYLGINYSIDYGSASTTCSVGNSSSARYITIKNTEDFGCRFVILNISGLPIYLNTGSTTLKIQLRLTLSSGTIFTLKSVEIPVGRTTSELNGTYYVDLVKNASYINICDIVHKAITPSSSIWMEPRVTDNFTTTSTNVSFNIDSPYPYLINNHNLYFSSSAATTSNTLLITVNNLTENNRYLKLQVGGLLSVNNTSNTLKSVYTKLKIGTTTLTLATTTIAAGKTAGFPTGTYYIDLINKTVIPEENITKAITQL